MGFLLMFGGRAPDRLFYIMGSVADGLCGASMLTLGQDIGRMKDTRTFQYYASLPISKIRFMLAMATSAMILALRSSLILLTAARFAFGIPIRPSPVLGTAK